MIIKALSIENFQSYYRSQVLDFSPGLNLIIGHGGKGKSKLFNAFYWVLFGDIYITDIGWKSTNGFPHNANFYMQRHEFINNKALSETPVDGEVRALVHLELEDDKGTIYEIERSTSATRLNHDNWKSPDAWKVYDNVLKVSYDSSQGTKVRTDYQAEDVINNLFPVDIRDYIWFQGESLDNLINFRVKNTLKAAVKHISYFPYYEKVSTIISSAKDKIVKLEHAKIRDNNKADSEIKGILTKIESLSNKIETEERNKSQLELNITM